MGASHGVHLIDVPLKGCLSWDASLGVPLIADCSIRMNVLFTGSR